MVQGTTCLFVDMYLTQLMIHARVCILSNNANCHPNLCQRIHSNNVKWVQCIVCAGNMLEIQIPDLSAFIRKQINSIGKC